VPAQHTSACASAWHVKPPVTATVLGPDAHAGTTGSATCLADFSNHHQTSERPHAYNMTRLRSFSFPRRVSEKDQEEHGMQSNSASSIHSGFGPAHSRSSSGASSVSSPITPTFSTSNRSHSRWPSSTSSLVSSVPDSPVNVNKSALHDLVEDPAERDDVLEDVPEAGVEEPLCICKSPAGGPVCSSMPS